MRVETTIQSRLPYLAVGIAIIVFWYQIDNFVPVVISIFAWLSALCALGIGLVILPATQLVLTEDAVIRVVHIKLFRKTVLYSKDTVKFGDIKEVKISDYKNKSIHIIPDVEGVNSINTKAFPEKEEIALYIYSKVDRNKLSERASRMIEEIRECREDS